LFQKSKLKKGNAMKKLYIGMDVHKAESEAINNFRRKQ
jgi:hypothetical protein